MTTGQERTPYKRRSIRLKDFDYSSEGAYCITLCAYKKAAFFEDQIINRIVEEEWLKTEYMRSGILLGHYIIMPNHFHAIICITDRIPKVGAHGNAPLLPQPFHKGYRTSILANIIRGFKATTTRQANILRKSPYMPLWQRGYYDRVIRNEKELQSIGFYIKSNPLHRIDDQVFTNY